MVLMILVILVIAYILTSYMQKKVQNRREAEHERRQDRFERLMDALRTQTKNNEASDKSDNEKRSNS